MVRRSTPPGDQQADFFAASFADIPIRDQRDTMERPFFSLAKKPRINPIEYNVGNVSVEVSSNPSFGMATIWDADILIWASTQITEALDRGLEAPRTIKFHPYNLLRSIRRSTGGADYQRLRAALDRLAHTAVRTNIRAEGKKHFASFHWIDKWTETTDEATGEPTGMTITIADWLYNGVVERGGVLTIHQDYFLLTGGIERWLYRVVRKHGGTQSMGWHFTMQQLHEKSGSSARLSDFAVDIREVVKANNLPEYELSIARNPDGEECVYFIHLSHLGEDHPRREHHRARLLESVQSEREPMEINGLLVEDSGDQA